VKISSDLHKAFLQTNYKVLPNKYCQHAITIQIGKELSELKVFTDYKSFGFLTAWNPLPAILTDEENKLRNQELKAEIANLGYEVYDGIGISKDLTWKESSFFILNIDLKTLSGLAKKYGQLAFVYGQEYSLSRLIYVSDLK
jgi:hypothetical protein